MRVDIPYELLDPTPNNARKHFVHIDELALTIGDHGLLHNLVVKEKPDGRFEVVAGERRRRAIGLLLLSVPEQMKQHGRPLGAWLGVGSVKSGSKEGGVPCFVIPQTSAEAAHFIENIGREDLWPWELGRRLVSFNDAGYDQAYIATIIGKSPSYVSKHLVIGRQLCREVTDAIEKTGDKQMVSYQTLLRIGRLYDPVMLEPLRKQQVEQFEKILGRPRTYTKEDEARSERHRVYDRAKKLRSLKVPGHAKLYVRAIYEFLFREGYCTKPDFDFK